MQENKQTPFTETTSALPDISDRAGMSVKSESIDEPFSYDGYQVVRREFFAHIHEPSITFYNCKVYFNTACLNWLPEVEYVQFLVSPGDKKLAVRPSSEAEKDSCLWCITRGARRRPKQMTCRIFFAKVMGLMGWNPDYRYKMLGKPIQSGDEHLFIFDLSATETYQRYSSSGGLAKSSRMPIFPAEWQNQFGLPVEEHRKLLQVNIFEGYTVFGLKDNSVSDSVPSGPAETLDRKDSGI